MKAALVLTLALGFASANIVAGWDTTTTAGDAVLTLPEPDNAGSVTSDPKIAATTCWAVDTTATLPFSGAQGIEVKFDGSGNANTATITFVQARNSIGGYVVSQQWAPSDFTVVQAVSSTDWTITFTHTDTSYEWLIDQTELLCY